MSGITRVTGPLLSVLAVLLEARTQDEEMHGWAIASATGLSGPTVYGVVDRLEGAGWIEGRWESDNPQSGKPRRRLYRLTVPGAVEGAALLASRRASVAGDRTGGVFRRFPGVAFGGRA